MPVDLFPDINIPAGRRRDLLQRHAAGADRDRHHRPLRAVLHARRAASITWSRGRCRASASSRCSSSPGTNADSDVTEISNLAMADLRRLPPGTLPPIVQKFDASSLPVCLITLQGRGPERDAAARPRAVHRSATSSPACRARRCRRPSAASTARSWSTSIRRSCRRTR